MSHGSINGGDIVMNFLRRLCLGELDLMRYQIPEESSLEIPRWY